MRSPFNRTLATSLLASLAFTSFAYADWQVLPPSSHAQYQTYALWDEPTNLLVYSGEGRGYAALGGAFTLLGDPSADWKPQVTLLGSVQSSLLFSSPGGGLAADELDARIGAAFEFVLNPMMRLSVGYLHISGQATSETLDPAQLLPGAGVSDHVVFARFVYDLGPYARAGVTFAPVIQGKPAVQFFGANQFVEIHPLGGLDESQKPSPYLALGLTENGTQAYGNQLSFHAQLGAYLGNHLGHESRPTLRPVVGFYTGADPRLNAFQLRGQTRTYGYVGILLDF